MQAEAGCLYSAGERSLDGTEAPGRAVGVTHICAIDSVAKASLSPSYPFSVNISRVLYTFVLHLCLCLDPCLSISVSMCMSRF